MIKASGRKRERLRQEAYVNGESLQSRIGRMKAGKVTKSQRRLLEYLDTADYNRLIYMSITQLAEEIGIVEATVLRFCRSLGFSGYQDFKLGLAQEMVSDTNRERDEIGYVADIEKSFSAAIENSCKHLSQEKLQQAIEMMLAARTIALCGVGHSYLAALAMHNCLLKMGILSHCEKDVHFQNQLYSTCGEEDLLIVFSISGGVKDVIEATSIARASGMKIIVVTCYEKSPLTRYADLVLATPPMESAVESGAMASKIIQFFMVDVLCTGLHLSDRARFDSNLARSNVSTAGKLV